MKNKPLYYQKAKEFLWLWEEIGSKKEAQKWMRRLEKAHDKAIKEGRLVDYNSLSVTEENNLSKSRKIRELKETSKNLFVNRTKESSDGHAMKPIKGRF